MTLTGYPDGQQSVQWIGPVLVEEFSLSVPTSPAQVASVPLGQWHGLELAVGGGAANIEVEIAWWTDDPDNGGTNLITRRQAVGPSQQVQWWEPALAPWVTISWMAESAGKSGGLRAWGSNQDEAFGLSSDAGGLLRVAEDMVGAGADGVAVVQGYRGPAVLWYRTSATSSTLLVSSRHVETESDTELLLLTDAASYGPAVLYVPGDLVTVAFHNGDGGTVTWTATLTAIR